MTVTLPTRQQIDQAAPLDFDQPRSERQANIQIEISPAGLHIRAEFTGALSSIPAAIERLRALGLVELVQASAQAPATPASSGASMPRGNRKPAAPRVAVEYAGNGDRCCPVHHKKLNDGEYGEYCSARARPGDVANQRGYCGLKFEE